MKLFQFIIIFVFQFFIGILSSYGKVPISTSEIHGMVNINSSPVSKAVIYLSGGDKGDKGSLFEYTIIQKDLKFDPPLLVIPQGSTVRFENQDDEIHNIYSKAKKNRFDTGAHLPGAVKKLTFKNTGPVTLRCNTHHQMEGMIYVAPSSYFSVSDSEGRFQIKNVPQANYKVEVWHPRLTPGELEEGTVTLEVKQGLMKLALEFSAKSGEGVNLSEVYTQNWDQVIQEMRGAFEKVMFRWKKGSKTGATSKVMSIQSRLYEESGLKNALLQAHGKGKVKGYDIQLDQIRRDVQGISDRPISESELLSKIETLISGLSEDIQKFQIKDR